MVKDRKRRFITAAKVATKESISVLLQPSLE
jgi:hypothetical protein